MAIPRLDEIEALARGAGEILREGFGQAQKVTHKGVIDLVTEYDERSEQYLMEKIANDFQGHKVMAEESGGREGDGECLWIVDPLDGTVNYAHGLPIFSVSLAFAVKGQVVMGVVYDPMRDECFTAEKGKGAWMNGDQLQVGGRERLGESLLVTGFPYDARENADNNLDHFAHMALRSMGVRRLGSAALDLCYIAAGRFDGYWEIRLEAWDIAGGGLIVREAGGTATNLQGKSDYLKPPYSIAAANPKL
ncbi:MAG: inositol monophosphatase, partial [Anaerolineae bacterium]|nr:inositol monophosphatase [Anaerolineae bacterium]